MLSGDLLSHDALSQAVLAKTRRFSEGIFWFFIAATILLALLDAHVSMQAHPPLSVAWAGVFVLYYAWRSSLALPEQRLPDQKSQSGQRRWLRWSAAVPLSPLLDLLIITGLVALSGGWASPLYMLYLGWSVALLDASSTAVSLGFTSLACIAFVLGVLLPPYRPLSALQITVTAEHALLLLLVGLGMSGIKVYIRHTRAGWEAERRRWDVLRQTVFSHLSHELYTPLSAVSASASLLAASGEAAAERQADLLRIIERNCARMNLLLDGLLALWRGDCHQLAYTPSCLRCLPLAQSVGQMLSPILEGKQQSLVVVAEPQDVCVLADRHQLEQVLVNLLANAHKYGPAGEVITLTISSQGPEVVFAVRDEGTGVPVEEQSRLFEWFYRGTNSLASSRGSGIGLALAKALVVLQGGRIWVESLPGQGSTFYFTLPAADPR